MTKYFPGILFLIVGNSGSGKDSIILDVVDKYPSNLKKVYAPKRYITRPPSETEKNISITVEEFNKMEENARFALHWHIYGLDYGIPIEIDNWLQKGHPVLLNVSRTIIKEARKKYKNLKVIFIKVPLEITIKRLKERGREKTELLEERIERARKLQEFPEADFTVDNSGDLQDSIDQFLTYMIKVVNEKES